MSRKEIIEMAEEAGMVTGPNLLFSEGQRYRSLGAPRNIKERHLLRFAALVEAKAAAKEREACAQVCDAEAERALFNWRNDLPSNQKFWNGAEQLASVCAAAIRARSTT